MIKVINQESMAHKWGTLIEQQNNLNPMIEYNKGNQI